ncbi:hypothetical protein MMC18_007746 [Xylographa bjoerkii]|nr:hypothetical protein [Xylographa bjoerkii]
MPKRNQNNQCSYANQTAPSKTQIPQPRRTKAVNTNLISATTNQTRASYDRITDRPVVYVAQPRSTGSPSGSGNERQIRSAEQRNKTNNDSSHHTAVGYAEGAVNVRHQKLIEDHNRAEEKLRQEDKAGLWATFDGPARR